MHYPNTERPYGDLLDDAVEMVTTADELGYDAVFVPEHHFVSYITLPSALQFISYCAPLTQRIRFVTAILILPYYHPMALAENIAQVDWHTRGRLEVGVARGAGSYEFDRLGVDFSHSREMFEEGLEVMKAAWTAEGEFSFDGQFYKFPGTTLIPKPLQKPYPPLWITAQSLPGARGAARFGTNVLTMPNYQSFAPFEDLPTLLNEYRAAGGGHGVEIGLARKTHIAETEAEALKQANQFVSHWKMYMSAFEARLDRRLEPRVDLKTPLDAKNVQLPIDLDLEHIYEKYDDPIITSPEKAIERVKYYEELGITYLIVNMAVGVPHQDVMKSLRLFATEVMPHFKKVPVGA
jgi:alkanesulfonate monooxygenase SsuD/methylene tetrahydromethanopterin reductase-like flavin-dependent oxidoreductase (luciferase family)